MENIDVFAALGFYNITTELKSLMAKNKDVKDLSELSCEQEVARCIVKNMSDEIIQLTNQLIVANQKIAKYETDNVHNNILKERYIMSIEESYNNRMHQLIEFRKNKTFCAIINKLLQHINYKNPSIEEINNEYSDTLKYINDMEK